MRSSCLTRVIIAITSNDNPTGASTNCKVRKARYHAEGTQQESDPSVRKSKNRLLMIRIIRPV